MSQTAPVARDEFFESLLGDFLDESGQLLDSLNDHLLQLDEWVRSLAEDHRERCDDHLLNQMFRSAHSLKGLSAMLGLTDINTLTHRVENVFDAARKNQLVITGSVVELMFQAVDRLVSLVGALKDPEAEPVECESIIGQIAQLLQASGAERHQSSQADAERALREIQIESAAAEPHPSTSEPASPPPAAGPPVDAPDAPDLFAGIRDEGEAPSKYLSIFIDETEMALDQLADMFVSVEGGGSRHDIEQALIISHRIKGSAASVGQNRAAKLAHLMEDLIQNVASAGCGLSAGVTDAMLQCTDHLRQYVEGLKKGNPAEYDFNRPARALLAAMPSAAVQTAPPAAGPSAAASAVSRPASCSPGKATVPDELRRRLAASVPLGSDALIGAVTFRPRLDLVGLKARLLFEKLSGVGDVFHFDPPAETLDTIDDLTGIRFAVATDKQAEAVAPILRVAGVQDVLVEPLVGEEAPPEASPVPSPGAAAALNKVSSRRLAGPPAAAEESRDAGRTAENAAKPAETLRVEIERLDQLMNLAGQLVISQARFAQLGEGLRSLVGDKQAAQSIKNVLASLGTMAESKRRSSDVHGLQVELAELRAQARRVHRELEPIGREVESLARAHAAVNELGEAIHQLGRVTDAFQQTVMDTRMVPIGPLFARFKRVIRDITRGNGKSIRLVIHGEKTELDKRMIDELSDPLIHMVRNAADHGIESPEDRQAAGKPPEGTVTLNAFHRGNSILIQVNDDGRGLDPESILRKALEKGLVSDGDAERLSRSQIFQLIWEPGLSTAQRVTEVSGRGMGMDIVKSKIEGLNGTVELDSEPGRGTTLSIKLPLTLAILPSLMVEIDRDVFAMPLESVAEIVGIRRADTTTVHGQWTARVRGRVVSVVRLDRVFTWAHAALREDQSESDELTLVIVGESGQEIGLAVDRVVGEQDVVIKSMAENYRNVPGIAGASILGDGRVSLILDVPALIAMASQVRAAASP
ncbi:MAG: chemotaxis protein CheA [Pirellulales bacterium]|nr:chemotaxis protein CheA [Pirellulales bacterium]